MGDAVDAGWRRGDRARWWDAERRCWRTGVLIARITIPTFDYDLETPEGEIARVAEQHLLRADVEPAAPASPPPPSGGLRRPGSNLRDRTGG